MEYRECTNEERLEIENAMLNNTIKGQNRYISWLEGTVKRLESELDEARGNHEDD